MERTKVRIHSWANKLLHSCGDSPLGKPCWGPGPGLVSWCKAAVPLYSLTPLRLGVPCRGRGLVILDSAQRRNKPPQCGGGGHQHLASHGHCRSSVASYASRSLVGCGSRSVIKIWHLLNPFQMLILFKRRGRGFRLRHCLRNEKQKTYMSNNIHLQRACKHTMTKTNTYNRYCTCFVMIQSPEITRYLVIIGSDL